MRHHPAVFERGRRAVRAHNSYTRCDRGQHTLEHYFAVKYGMAALRLVAGTTVILFVVGGISVGAATDEGHLHTADTICRAGYVIVLVVLVAICGIAAYCFINRGRILKYRRRVGRSHVFFSNGS